jgi:hypothetical protein
MSRRCATCSTSPAAPAGSWPCPGTASARVEASGDRRYLAWALEIRDYWQSCLDATEPPFAGWGAGRARQLDDPRFAYLSSKDRLLIRDALSLECDVFLTIEKRLARNAPHLQREIGLQVIRPPELAELLFRSGT